MALDFSVPQQTRELALRTREFVDTVVPILQERGHFRTEYSGPTLRDHLGLPASKRPVSGRPPSGKPGVPTAVG